MGYQQVVWPRSLAARARVGHTEVGLRVSQGLREGDTVQTAETWTEPL